MITADSSSNAWACNLPSSKHSLVVSVQQMQAFGMDADGLHVIVLAQGSFGLGIQAAGLCFPHMTRLHVMDIHTASAVVTCAGAMHSEKMAEEAELLRHGSIASRGGGRGSRGTGRGKHMRRGSTASQAAAASQLGTLPSNLSHQVSPALPAGSHHHDMHGYCDSDQECTQPGKMKGSYMIDGAEAYQQVQQLCLMQSTFSPA